MTKFIISHPGDPSVGIPGDEATVALETDGTFWSDKDRAEFVQNAKENLVDCFKAIWGAGRVSCVTQEEAMAIADSMEHDNRHEECLVERIRRGL